MNIKLSIAVIVFSFLSLALQGQRVAIVDVNDILENLDDYQAAQNEIDEVTAKWRQNIAQEYDKIKSLFNRYQAEKVLLSEDAKMEREEEITNKEREVRELQKRRFGEGGDLFRRRQELVSPIQDQVFTAIEEYAKIKGYDIILDKSSAAGLLYLNDEFDKTAEIKRELGIRSN